MSDRPLNGWGPSGPPLPTLYIPHGGGPCFFMDWTMGPPDTFAAMAAWLGQLGHSLASAQTPAVRALLVISAHWEAPVISVQSGAQPPLVFDYVGFPPHTYKLTWPAPGAPALAARVRGLLGAGGMACALDARRGFDHGTFVPLKVAFPDARIPTLQVSLHASLDPGLHMELGRLLAPLRHEGVLIVGSGMSFHNMQAFMQPGHSLDRSREFDDWLVHTCATTATQRADLLADWARAPSGRFSHPREDHLLPLMVAAGAAQAAPGRQIFSDQVMGVAVSAIAFGASPTG